MEWVLVITLFINGESTRATITSWYENEMACLSASTLDDAIIELLKVKLPLSATISFEGECEPHSPNPSPPE